MLKKSCLALLGFVLSLSLALVPSHAAEIKKVDVLLVGGGIMSATLGVWLNELEPGWSMEMVERLDGVAQESSNVRNNVLKNPRSFINSTPHMSFVWGDDNIKYLKKRYEALQASPLFRGMQYSEDPEQIKKWVPLMMEGRAANQKVAATWTPIGTDVNFGEITNQFVTYLKAKPNFSLKLSSEVQDITRNADGTWRIGYKNLKDGTRTQTDAKFVFIGAGGGALRLLQKSGIPEANDYAGFPVGGSFLVTDNPAIAERHLAKAYGKASVGAPPMSVPHLDTRVLDGKRVILFGPFATFSTKFLKEGSHFDLFSSMTTHNIWPMMQVGVEQYPLVEYLAGQLMLSDDDRFNALKEYFPDAKKEDWRLWQAGQRVQIIKRDDKKGGELRLGTEVVASRDGSIAGLLGASPGASTAAPIMLNVLEKVFKDKVATPAWQSKIRQIVPSYGTRLNDNPDRVYQEWLYTSQILQLMPPPAIDRTVLPQAPQGDQTKSKPKADLAL